MTARYYWCGEPIADIFQWCRDRGEKMIRYRYRDLRPSVFGGATDPEMEFGEMPESFWNNLRYDIYDEFTLTERYQP